MTNEDNYELVERAKSLVPMDETNEQYYTFLFIALRAVGCSVKASIKLILSKIKESGGVVNYHLLYRNLQAYVSIIQEVGKPGMIIQEEDVEKLEKQNRPPGNNLGQMIWIETITRYPKSMDAFAREMKKVRAEIVNLQGG